MKKTSADMSRAPDALTLRMLQALVPVLALMISCNGSDGDSHSNLFINLMATDVTPSSIRLSITASFNAGNTPLWRTDKPGLLAHFDLQSNVASFYSDTDVAPGSKYCYMAGGHYLGLGNIYSNEECVTIPS